MIGRYHLFCGLLLLAAPLAAQQTVVVPNVNVEVQVEPTPFEIFIQPSSMSDSAMVANLAENNRLLRERLTQEQGCNTCGGTSTVVRIGQSTLILIGAFMAWQLKRIADKPNGDDVHNEGDTNVEVNVPPHDHGHHDQGEN